MYYGYIRAERDGNSVQVQMETIRAFAEERGFSLSSWLEIKSARSEKKSEILSAGDETVGRRRIDRFKAVSSGQRRNARVVIA